MKMQAQEIKRMEVTIEDLKSHEKYHPAPTDVTNKFYARYDHQ